MRKKIEMVFKNKRLSLTWDAVWCVWCALLTWSAKWNGVVSHLLGFNVNLLLCFFSQFCLHYTCVILPSSTYIYFILFAFPNFAHSTLFEFALLLFSYNYISIFGKFKKTRIINYQSVCPLSNYCQKKIQNFICKRE